jgi:LysM repeat protein
MTPGPSHQQEASKAKSTTAAPVVARQTGATGKPPIMEARASNAVVHHVKQGETLWSIAQAYRTTVEAIQAGNRYLFSRPLQVGDTLTILQAR